MLWLTLRSYPLSKSNNKLIRCVCPLHRHSKWHCFVNMFWPSTDTNYAYMCTRLSFDIIWTLLSLYFHCKQSFWWKLLSKIVSNAGGIVINGVYDLNLEKSNQTIQEGLCMPLCRPSNVFYRRHIPFTPNYCHPWNFVAAA